MIGRGYVAKYAENFFWKQWKKFRLNIPDRYREII